MQKKIDEVKYISSLIKNDKLLINTSKSGMKSPIKLKKNFLESQFAMRNI